MQKIVIINTRCANFSSVMMALKRLCCESVVSDDADTIRSADKLILPGVGTAAAGMENIEKYHLKELITETKKPLLGICLGMQLLSQMSSENAGTGSQEIGCLGVVPGTVSLLKAGGLRLPHMGWDQVDVIGDCPLFEGIPNHSYFYFVHSYALSLTEKTAATCTYGEKFTACVHNGNFFGVQFHPEKSGSIGARLLQNFLGM
jgi:glutamine amidotransferase